MFENRLVWNKVVEILNQYIIEPWWMTWHKLENSLKLVMSHEKQFDVHSNLNLIPLKIRVGAKLELDSEFMWAPTNNTIALRITISKKKKVKFLKIYLQQIKQLEKNEPAPKQRREKPMLTNNWIETCFLEQIIMFDSFHFPKWETSNFQTNVMILYSITVYTVCMRWKYFWNLTSLKLMKCRIMFAKWLVWTFLVFRQISVFLLSRFGAHKKYFDKF